MPIIYIDNFRGFHNTYLPLSDVNFFVGENSTGKTSILKLIGIISSPGFWRFQQFYSNDINGFGSFNEMISMRNTNQDFFEIAMLLEEHENKKFIALKLRFIEKDNFPTVKEINYSDDYINIQASIEGTFLKYKYDLLSHKIDNPITYFKSWIVDNGLKEKAFLKNEIEFMGIISILLQLQSLIIDNLGAKGQDELIKYIRLTPPPFLKNVAYIAPTRAEPVRTYDSYNINFNTEGTHTPYVLKDILKNEAVKKIIEKFGFDSGLYDSISIKEHGQTKTDPFEILIGLNEKALNITNVGYGVSQVLPLVTEIVARPPESWFAIQQPEVHLHPRAQSAFGDLIYKSNVVDKHNFIVETHSDYTIDRYRLRINKDFRNKKTIDSTSQVIFFNRSNLGNHLDIIPIQPDGSYPEEQPSGFRDFFINEQLELIKI